MWVVPTCGFQLNIKSSALRRKDTEMFILVEGYIQRDTYSTHGFEWRGESYIVLLTLMNQIWWAIYYASSRVPDAWLVQNRMYCMYCRLRDGKMVHFTIVAETNVHYAIKCVLFLHALQGTNITIQKLHPFILAHGQ